MSLEIAPGVVHGRRFPVQALEPPRASDPAGSIVLGDELGERLVLRLADDIGIGELCEFSRVLAAAVRMAT